MASHRYLALLRGINVGGNNIIRMADLRAAFEDLGLTEVSTYIQSGNVLFSAEEKDGRRMEAQIEQGLSKRFDYQAWLLVLSRGELEEVLAGAPPGFGARPDAFRYDVIFLKPPARADEVMAQINPREGVDKALAGERALYFRRLIERASSSRLSKIASLPVYRHLTIRNWNTTTKLFALLKT